MGVDPDCESSLVAQARLEFSFVQTVSAPGCRQSGPRLMPCFARNANFRRYLGVTDFGMAEQTCRLLQATLLYLSTLPHRCAETREWLLQTIIMGCPCLDFVLSFGATQGCLISILWALSQDAGLKMDCEKLPQFRYKGEQQREHEI